MVQRQQIKWVVFGLSGTLGGWFAAEALGSVVFPELLRPGSPWALLSSAGFRAVWLLIPLSIGGAVLRYRQLVHALRPPALDELGLVSAR